MSAQRQRGVATTTEQTTVPGNIDSPRAKLVYHSLDAVGTGSVDDLADRLDMGKMTLLSVLASLEGRDLVDRHDGKYVVTTA
jgi:predicted ArsR family transcriptional regulator